MCFTHYQFSWYAPIACSHREWHPELHSYSLKVLASAVGNRWTMTSTIQYYASQIERGSCCYTISCNFSDASIFCLWIIIMLGGFVVTKLVYLLYIFEIFVKRRVRSADMQTQVCTTTTTKLMREGVKEVEPPFHHLQCSSLCTLDHT